MTTKSDVCATLRELIDEASKLESRLAFGSVEIAPDDYEDVVAAITMAEGLIFQSLQIARGEA